MEHCISWKCPACWLEASTYFSMITSFLFLLTPPCWISVWSQWLFFSACVFLRRVDDGGSEAQSGNDRGAKCRPLFDRVRTGEFSLSPVVTWEVDQVWVILPVSHWGELLQRKETKLEALGSWKVIVVDSSWFSKSENWKRWGRS